MMVARSSAGRVGDSVIGWCFAMRSAHFSPFVSGASGVSTRGSDAGMPGSMAAKPSSLPMTMSFASEWSMIWPIVSAVSVGYSGTTSGQRKISRTARPSPPPPTSTRRGDATAAIAGWTSAS